MKPVQVRIDYSVDDFVRALIFIRHRRRYYLISSACFGFLFGMFGFFVLVLVFGRDDAANRLPLLLTGAIAGVGAGVLYYFLVQVIDPIFLRRSVRKQIANSPMLQGVNEVDLGDEGLHGYTFLSDSTIKWPAVIEVVETDSDFHFFTSPRFAYFVPKTALGSADEIDELREGIRGIVGDRLKSLVEK